MAGSNLALVAVIGDCAVNFTGDTGSQYGIDDIIMVTTPIEAPQSVTISTGVVDDVMGLCFDSTSGDVYQLESAADPGGSNWVFTGMSMVGTGTNVYLFDPPGKDRLPGGGALLRSRL